MHKLTFFPIGNADCCLVDLAGGPKLLFDYANCPDTEDASDKRIDLAAVLRADLKAARRRDFDVVAFTHADDDHVRGMSEFFHLDHAAKYQGEDRIRIGQLWAPAAVIVEAGLDGDARVLQAEARYRLKRGTGIRIFSRPDALKDWCADNGISWADRQHLMTDAGQLVPEFVKSTHGVEFFVHSPFAVRLPDGKVVDRNDCSLVLQATFTLNGRDTRLILSADTTWENFVPMVNITRAHGRAHRLEWDIFSSGTSSNSRTTAATSHCRIRRARPSQRRWMKWGGCSRTREQTAPSPCRAVIRFPRMTRTSPRTGKPPTTTANSWLASVDSSR